MSRLRQLLRSFSAALRRQVRPQPIPPHRPPIAYVQQPELELTIYPLAQEQHDSPLLYIRIATDSPPIAIHASNQPDAIHWAKPDALIEPDKIRIHQPRHAARMYYEIELEDGRRIVTATRFLPFEQLPNFRDIGGYPTASGQRVRWGRVFRSGALAEMSPADEGLIASLHLHWICDLRSPQEAADAPTPPVSGAHYVHLPMTSTDDTLNRLRALLFDRKALRAMLPKMYREIIIDQNAAIIGQTLLALADAGNLPALLHCSAGKDRTGVTIAILLLLLGVPEETVIADYTLSNYYYEDFYRFAARALRPMAWMGISAESIFPLLIADGQTLQAALDHIRIRYGSVEQYAQHAAGVDAAALERLRALLLE